MLIGVRSSRPPADSSPPACVLTYDDALIMGASFLSHDKSLLWACALRGPPIKRTREVPGDVTVLSCTHVNFLYWKNIDYRPRPRVEKKNLSPKKSKMKKLEHHLCSI